jgi:hypothetical protein
LYVFYDGNQKIYREQPVLPACPTEFDLTRNLRNTRAIQRLAARFYPEDEFELTGPEGRPVELVAASGANEVRKAVSRLVHRLVSEDGIPAGDIALLTGRSPKKSVLAAEATLGSVALTREPGEAGKLLLESVHRFKGLERPVVVLAEIDGALHQQRLDLLYVGLTRARAHLAVVAAQSTLDALQARPPSG